jgi:selenide, water dikinase
MGGVPKTAMNLVCFPLSKMDISVLRKILEGGLNKIKEAGVVLVGGHSVEDNELKYGLSVTGFIHPDEVLTKNNLIPGDKLILTKSLGSGIINTAIKGGVASKDIIEEITILMKYLNRDAAEVITDFPVHACTDITGFGLLGHIAEMVEGSELGINLFSKNFPVIPEAFEYAGMGFVPAGAYKNQDFRKNMVEFSKGIDSVFQNIMFDPQTSGGLLISVDGKSSDDLVASLKNKGMDSASVIGEVVSGPSGKIIVH